MKINKISKRVISFTMLFLFAFVVSFVDLTPKAFAATNNSRKSKAELERLFSSQSTPEEKQEFVKSRFNSSDENTTKIKEFDLCKSIDSNKAILPNQNNSKVKEYLKKLKELSKKDKFELQLLGYDYSKIQAIKSIESINYDENNSLISPELAVAATNASSECILNLGIEGYYYDTTYDGSKFQTQVYVTSEWHWSSQPIAEYDDSFTVAWASSTNLLLYKTFDAVNYINNVSKATFTTDYSNDAFRNSVAGAYGSSYNFPVQVNLAPSIYNVATSGYSMDVLVSTDYHVGSCGINVAYGHSYVPLSPSISVAYGLISIGFGPLKQGWAYKLSKFFMKSKFDAGINQ